MKHKHKVNKYVLLDALYKSLGDQKKKIMNKLGSSTKWEIIDDVISECIYYRTITDHENIYFVKRGSQ